MYVAHSGEDQQVPDWIWLFVSSGPGSVPRTLWRATTGKFDLLQDLLAIFRPQQTNTLTTPFGVDHTLGPSADTPLQYDAAYGLPTVRLPPPGAVSSAK